VLHHLERLDPASIEETAGHLDRLAGATPRPWVIGTLDAGPGSEPGPSDALLRRFTASVTVPALRHRIEDLYQLVPLLFERLAPGRQVGCTPEAMRTLLGYIWPGNVRQLEQALRAALTRRRAGDIRPEDLPGELSTSSHRPLTPLETLERDAIVAALQRAGDNRFKAAADLGISRSSLYRKLRAYGMA
jgi:transcriptional regulator of acetoin/glycerol metabolism